MASSASMYRRGFKVTTSQLIETFLIHSGEIIHRMTRVVQTGIQVKAIVRLQRRVEAGREPRYIAVTDLQQRRRVKMANSSQKR